MKASAVLFEHCLIYCLFSRSLLKPIPRKAVKMSFSCSLSCAFSLFLWLLFSICLSLSLSLFCFFRVSAYLVFCLVACCRTRFVLCSLLCSLSGQLLTARDETLKLKTAAHNFWQINGGARRRKSAQSCDLLLGCCHSAGALLLCQRAADKQYKPQPKGKGREEKLTRFSAAAAAA